MDTGTNEHLRGVWIAPDNTAFAVGDGGTILRHDGSGWSPMVSGTTEALFDVWGSSATDVAASGNIVLHYQGSSWEEIMMSSWY